MAKQTIPPTTARMIPAAPLATPPSSVPPTAESTRPIKVRATEMGYYDHGRRRPGDVFYLADQTHFSQKWMELVDASTPERVTGAKQALQREHDEILAGRTPGADTVEI